MSLHQPDFHVNNVYMQANFAREMAITMDLSESDQQALLELTADPEYMLRYQVVAMAKCHNFFGGVDRYMKEFARVAMDTGDRNVQRNLERLLNTEVAIPLNRAKGLLQQPSDNYAVHPGVLQQPGFRY